jgi:EAL domain-containing protein (putative c-di-GMP-specific phosphodiesterase class I)
MLLRFSSFSVGFDLVFQPKVAFSHGKLGGIEVLLAELKIDREDTAKLGTVAGIRHVGQMIEQAKAAGLKVTAEGIECRDHLPEMPSFKAICANGHPARTARGPAHGR